MKDMSITNLPCLISESGILFDDVLRVNNKLKMFLGMDDRSLQRVLREVDNVCLAQALIGASDEMREKAFSNCSIRLAEMLKEDMAFIGQIEFSKVEEKVDSMVKIAKMLEGAGEIYISDIF